MVHKCCVFDLRGRGVAAVSLAVAMVALLLPGVALVRVATGAAGLAGVAGVRPAALVARLGAIPALYLGWYVAAARTCPGLRWEVLAGIGTIESDNGRSHARGVYHGKNRKGAEGPMQFDPATFADYAGRADRSARLTPYDPQDAIFTAARMLCADGAGSARGLRGAIFAYNHARWYVRDVLALAARYSAASRLRCAAFRSVRHRGRRWRVHRRVRWHWRVRWHGHRGRRGPGHGWCGRWTASRLADWPVGRLAGCEFGQEGRHRGVDRDAGRQRMRVGPVEVAQGNAIVGDPRVVLGGLQFARGLLERGTVVLGSWIHHRRSSPVEVPGPGRAGRRNPTRYGAHHVTRGHQNAAGWHAEQSSRALVTRLLGQEASLLVRFHGAATGRPAGPPGAIP